MLKILPALNAQPDSSDNILPVRHIDQIEVRGFRNQMNYAIGSRFVTVISGDEMRRSGIQNISDLLEYFSNADIRQRGPFGVQADLSIRGGSFDHVMVLLNGINLSDPQTGHASLDLPLDVDGIEKIEILEGSSARVLGPGAFTGAVNIITRRVASDQLSVSMSVGDYGLFDTHISGSVLQKHVQQFLSAGMSSSDGYMEDTDFSQKRAYYGFNFKKGITQVDAQIGLLDKKFGAAGFYSPRFPNQYEENQVVFTGIRATTGEHIRFSPQVYWRHRKDHFLLDRSNPAFYENFHRTDIWGSQLNISWLMGPLHSTLGIDLRSENILSNNIGLQRSDPTPVRGEDSVFYDKGFNRNNLAIFQDFSYNKGRFGISGGLMLNWNTSFPEGPSVFPGLDIRYQLTDFISLFTSFNRALHYPTFTDLFYTDPVHHGNMQLRPNHLVAVEAGLKLKSNLATGSMAIFRNSGKDIVDWLWSYPNTRYSPVNLEHFLSQGLEASLVFQFSNFGRLGHILRLFSVNYLFLDVRKSLQDSVSKYYNLKHKFSVVARHALIRKLEAEWLCTYQDRYGEAVDYDPAGNQYIMQPYKPVWLLEGTVRYNDGNLLVFVAVSNLLDNKYIDAGTSLQPGRWFRIGMTFHFEKIGEALTGQ